jgi:hypothetical protein
LWAEGAMISWEMAAILVLLAFILGMMVAIKMIKA